MTKSISFNKVAYGDVLQKARVCMGIDVNDEAAAEAMAATGQGGEGVGVTDEARDTNVAEEVTVSAPTEGRRDVVLHDPGDDGA